MKFPSPVLLILLFSFISCTKINPDQPTFTGDPAILPKAVSTINFPLELPLSFLENQLNQGLKELVYAEKDLAIGNGLATDINVYRTGEINVFSKGKNNLSIKFPMRLQGNLKVEKKIFGQLISTSLPYDETLLPEISFSPDIGKDWDLSIKNLRIESWGRSLKYDLLGYEFDLDPIIRKNVENILNNQLNQNGFSRISFKNMMEKTWKAYGEPVKIEQGKIDVYFYTVPDKIKINEKVTADQMLQLNIGLEGEVITQLGERPQVSPGPLPDLDDNPDTLNHLAITLPIAISYGRLNEYLNDALVGRLIRIDHNTSIIPKKITTQSFGNRALVKVAFKADRLDKKDMDGEVFLVGKPVYDRETKSIVFEDLDFELNTKNILANSANWFKQNQFLDQIKKQAVYPIENYLQEARMELKKQAFIYTDFASFSLNNTTLDVQGIYLTEEDIRLYLDATAKMEVKLKK